MFSQCLYFYTLRSNWKNKPNNKCYLFKCVNAIQVTDLVITENVISFMAVVR